MIDFIVEATGLKKGSRVVDLAAGSGKLTEILAKYEFTLNAVEPAPGMRTGFTKLLPNVPVHDGTASICSLFICDVVF